MRGIRGSAVAIGIVLLLVVGVVIGTTKYQQIPEGQRGLILDQGRFVGVQQPGLFFRPFAPFVEVRTVDVTRQTLEIAQNVASSDKQLYDISIAVDFQRNSGDESLQRQLAEVGLDDTKVQALISGFANDALKSSTTQYTLDEVLADRGALATRLSELLRPNLSSIYIDLLAVKVLDVVVDPAYAELLKQKANLEVQIETAEKQQELIQADQANLDLQVQRAKARELTEAQANTEIALENANRERQVRDIEGQYYRDNPELLELRQRELAVQMLQAGNVYFIDPNTDLTLLLNQLTGTASSNVPAVIIPQDQQGTDQGQDSGSTTP